MDTNERESGPYRTRLILSNSTLAVGDPVRFCRMFSLQVPPLRRNTLAKPSRLFVSISGCLAAPIGALIRVHLRLGFDQGFVEHFVNGADGTELEALFGFGGYFFQVFLVSFGEKHDVDAGA